MTRLLTVIGHGVKLLPHFINHYKNYVDEINIVVYESELYPTLNKDVTEIIKNYDDVKIVRVHQDRVFDWDKVTMLYNYITNKESNDWWVIADIDEFHLYPDNDLNKIINHCEENDFAIVRGGFIDRIGPNGEFPNLKSKISIWEQFPNAGFFRHPMSGANPNKICIKKGFVLMTSGQHYVDNDGHSTWKWQGWNHPLIYPHGYVQVHHFKWDDTSIERIQEVADIKQEYAFSNEYDLMFRALRKSNFKIDLNRPDFMFELDLTTPDYYNYKKWGLLSKKIISI